MAKEYFDYIISLGSDCSVAGTLRELKFKHYSFPFDWNVTHLEFIKNTFKNKFENFLDFKYCKSNNGHMRNPESTIHFYHDYEYHKLINDATKKEEFEKKFTRRCERIVNLLRQPKKILFVFKSEKDTVTDIIELMNIIKKSFPIITFKILLINNIDEQSNIDNIIHFKIDKRGFLGKVRVPVHDKCAIQGTDYYAHRDSTYPYFMINTIINNNFTSQIFEQPLKRDDANN